MAHCVNPECKHPENEAGRDVCASCGSSLLLNGRYEIMRSLGQGGFGATFLSRNRSLPGQPYCVIKQLRPTSTAPNVLKMARDLFQREAKTLGKIGSHPQIPTLMDYFEDRTEFYLVQEFIKGYTLHQEVKKNGPFNEESTRQLMSELLPMLEYIHSQQVIHRDIKPANIIRRAQDKKLVMIDFGAVKDKVNPAMTSVSEQTALTSYAIGTPGYAPPEQMAMRPVYSSDIYAVGVTCLYLLTAKSPKDLNYNPATGEIMWRDYVHVSDHFSQVLSKMLEVSVKHRYQNPREVLQALKLEPYMDSLVGGMMSQPVHNAHNALGPASGSTRGEASSQNGTSPTARMAQAIRARKQAAQKRRVGGRQTHTQLNSMGRSGGRTSGGRSSTSNLNSRGSTTRGGMMSSGRTGSTGRMKKRLHPMELQKRYERGDRDFTSFDFRTVNLQRLVLSGANFHETSLSGANLQSADLSNCDLGQANLSQARLRGVRLAKAYMSHANLQEADLRGADLTNAYLSNANLRGANLCGANLMGAKVTDEQLSLAKLNWSTIFPNGRRGGLW